MKRPFAICLGLVGLSLIMTLPAQAQLSNLDKTTLIENLRKHEMSELLKHMVDTEPMDDPILLRQVKINQLLLDYKNAMDDFAQSGDEMDRQLAIDYFGQAMQGYRELIDDFRDNPQRPLWQTNLAEQLLFENLQTVHRSAAEFYEFGVPSQEQREAYEAGVAEALEQLLDAELRFFTLRGEIPKRADFTEKFEDTGLWSRMITQYADLRTAYFVGMAAHLGTLLPDSHPYFANLGQNRRLPNQADSPEAERQRLRDIALEKLAPFVEDENDEFGVHADSLSLTGRLLMHQDNLAEAQEALEQAVAAVGTPNLTSLRALMAQAQLEQRKGDTLVAIGELTDVENHPMVSSSLLYQLLEIDLHHRLLMNDAVDAPAEERRAALEAAYEPYVSMLGELPAGSPLRNYIYKRWEASLAADADLSELPAVVLLGMGDMALAEGRNLAVEGFQNYRLADQTGDESARAEGDRSFEQAQPKLEKAIATAQALLDRENLDPQLIAAAMYSKGLATYFKDPFSVDNQVDAARIFIELADNHVEQKVAAEAIAYATGGILRPLHAQQQQRTEAVHAVYQEAVNVLLEKYPNSEAADSERLYYAVSVLIPAEDHARAVEVLEGVPSQHGDYIVAQAAMLESLLAMLEDAEEGDRQALRTRVIEQASTLERDAEEVEAMANEQEMARLRWARGRARLAQAEAQIDAGDITTGVALLDNFDKEFPDQPDLVRRALEKQITALVDAARYDEAARQADRMMRQFPDDAAYVIDQVLIEMEQTIKQLRQQAAEEMVQRQKNALEEQAQALSSSAVVMANALNNWAATQDFGPEEMAGFRVIFAKSLRLSGEVDESIAILQPMREDLPNDLGVIHNLAEAYFAKGAETGNHGMLIEEAAPLYDKIISGVAAVEGKYPAQWWNAWARRLRILDIVGQSTSDIPVRVRQLERTDPNLGGEPYKSILTGLKISHS